MSFAELRRDAIEQLTHWPAPDADLATLRRAYLDHLVAHDEPMSRDGLPHHFTTGGFVFDPELQRVALVMHRKARLWLQPGGHFEVGDRSVIDAALREIREETGLEVRAEQAQLVDLHHHELSAAFGRCRSHLDIRVAVVLDESAPIVVSEESDDAAWWPVDALPEPTDPDLPATISRIRDLLQTDRPPTSPAAQLRS